VNVPTIVRVRSSNRKVLNGTASIIAMKSVPAVTQTRRDLLIGAVATKIVNAKEYVVLA